MTDENTQTGSLNVTGERLRSFIERVERMNEEITTCNEDKSEIFAEAKGEGFDTKIMKKIIQRRKKDAGDLAEEDAIMETYLAAMGMA